MFQRERQRRMEEEMKTQREVDRKEEAERERVSYSVLTKAVPGN